jgi:hypothetical protein
VDRELDSPRNGLVLTVLFTEGAVCLAAAVAVVLSGWPDPNDEAYDPVIWTLIGGLAISALLMLLRGVSARGRPRWTAFALVSVLVLGFSALTSLSIGVLIAPIGLLLLGFSLGKLFSLQPARASN